MRAGGSQVQGGRDKRVCQWLKLGVLTHKRPGETSAGVISQHEDLTQTEVAQGVRGSHHSIRNALRKWDSPGKTCGYKERHPLQ